MRKILFLSICIFLFNEIAFAKIVIEKLPDPPYMNMDGSTYTVGNNADKNSEKNVSSDTRKITTSSPVRPYGLNSLNSIERRIYGRNFRGDMDANRIARLERQVFGAVQGGSIDSRLRRLKTATQNYSNKINYDIYNPYNPNNYGTRPGLVRRILDNVSGGTLTGFSPAINPYDPYNRNYNYNQYNPYNAYRYGTRNLQNPYSGATSFYSPNTTRGTRVIYNNPGQTNYSNVPNTYVPQYVKSNTGYRNIFSDGGSGDEFYYDDGRFQKNIKSTDGGCSVTIIDD